MTTTNLEDDFESQRCAVLNSHLQLALQEISELEAIVDAIDHKITDLQGRASLMPNGAAELRKLLADDGNERLREYTRKVRQSAFKGAAAVVAGIVDEDLVRDDSVHGDAARAAFEKALRFAHGRLMTVAEVEG